MFDSDLDGLIKARERGSKTHNHPPAEKVRPPPPEPNMPGKGKEKASVLGKRPRDGEVYVPLDEDRSQEALAWALEDARLEIDRSGEVREVTYKPQAREASLSPTCKAHVFSSRAPHVFRSRAAATRLCS